MSKRGNVRLVAAAIAAISLHALVLMLLPASVNEMSVATQQGALQVELLAHHSNMDLETAQHNEMNKRVLRPVTTEKQLFHEQALEKQTFEKKTPEKSISQPSFPKPVMALEPKALSPVVTVIQVAGQSTAAVRSAMKDRVKLAVAERVALKRIRSESATTESGSAKSGSAKPAPAKPDSKKSDRSEKKHSVIDQSKIIAATSLAEQSNTKRGANVVPQNVQNRILVAVHYPKQARRHGWQGRAEFEFDVHQQSIQTVTLLASSGYPILDRAAHRGLSAVQHVSLSNGLYRMPVVFRLQ